LLQVEVKIRLPDKAAHDRVAELLSASQQHHYKQENYFFDGTMGELEAQRIVLRVRLYNVDEKATITIKACARRHGRRVLPDLHRDLDGT
jgi:inorganic triphosphatase YgiF